MKTTYWIRNLVVAFCVLSIFFTTVAQKDEEIVISNQQTYPLEVSVFNLGTFLPGGGKAGIWSVPIHPGFDIGTRYYWSRKNKSTLFQVAKIGYFRHVHAQQGLQLYTGLTYQYAFTPRFFASGQIGIGYLASIPDLQVFTFKDGQYVRSKKIRSQFMGELMIDIGWKVSNSLDVYLAYQFWLQTPFVNKYVPILPNNAVHLGVVFYHDWFSKTN